MYPHELYGENIKRGAFLPFLGKYLATVTKVDDRGRIKLPKEVARPGNSVVIIDAKSYFLGITIPKDPLQYSGSWLTSNEGNDALRKIAEEEAMKDAVNRAKRRKQLN
ncbi:MAG: VapB-type antitoxin [Nitrososphaerales archaeon]